MKRIILAVFVGGVVISVFFLASRAPQPPQKSQAASEPSVPVLSPTPVSALPLTATPLFDGDAISLIGNYTEHKTSADIQEQYRCDYLVNAGFYTKENTPVGYVQSNEEVLGRDKDSALFDGYVTVNEMGIPRITRSLPKDKSVFALQSGPILLENAKALPLQIKNDKQARRVFALITGENKIMFGIVTSSTLTDLPKVIYQWAAENKIHAADAINLDGGSASTYRGPNGVFPEISPIGSAFCVKLP